MAEVQPTIATTPPYQGELPSQIAGRFLVRSCLGKGGMGEVYLADDSKMKHPVAIKRLAAPLRADMEYRQRFFREAERASQLKDYRNVAAIYDVLEDDGELFLIMEYVEGQTLRQRMAQPVSFEQFLKIAIQCAAGLAAAHAHHIVHCDVKPENIMLTPEDQIKILDFGLAKHFVPPDASTISFSGFQMAGGTTGYTAPEVLCEQTPDERADIFSLGVVFYELLTGTRPFHAETPVGMAARILQDEPIPVRRLNVKVPLELDRIVSRMLAKDRRLRYANASELLPELRQLREETSQTARFARYIVKSAGWKRGVAFTAALVLMLALAIPAARNRVKDWFFPPPIPQTKHLAVLPFTVVEGNDSQKAFSYGLAETLSAKLSQLSEDHSIYVVAPSEIRAQHVETADQARRAFGANLVLEGNLRQSGNVMRITYALVNSQDRQQLRAATIAEDASDPFAVEDRVSASVLKALELELRANEQAKFRARGTMQPDAYDFYLQARGYLQDYHKPENLQNAVFVFQRALERDPNYALAYAGLGEAYWQRFLASHDKTWVDQALAACQKASALAPDSAEAEGCLGVVYNGTGQYELAAQQFQKAIGNEPTDDAAYRGLADALERMGKPAAAELTYKQAVQLRPNYWAAYNDLGMFYWKQGRYREGEEMFSHVTLLQPDNVRGYSNLGAMLILEGRYAEAIPSLQRAIAINPSFDLYSNLATAYFYSRNYADAATAYEFAAQLDPRNCLIQGNLGDAYYWAPGKRAYAANAYRKAIALANEELRVNPKDEYLLGNLAKYHAMLGERQAALDSLKRGLTITPDVPELLFDVAFVHQQFGETDEALRWLAKSIRVGFSVANVRDDPVFASLKTNPQFHALMKQGGEKH